MTFDEFWKHYVGGDKDKSARDRAHICCVCMGLPASPYRGAHHRSRRTGPVLGASGSWEAELLARVEALEKAAQRRVDCGHDDECGGKQRDRCGCGHT